MKKPNDPVLPEAASRHQDVVTSLHQKKLTIPHIDDRLWERIAAILPPPKRHRQRGPGRKRLPDRNVLNGLVYLLATGTSFEKLPRGLGFGSGMTCWNRLADWKRAGVWTDVAKLICEGIPSSVVFDWSRFDRLDRKQSGRRIARRENRSPK